MNTTVTRDSIFKGTFTNRESIEVPEWGGQEVWIKKISGNQKTSLAKASKEIDEKHPDDGAARLQCHALVRYVVDQEGQRIFNDDDASKLLDQPATAIQRLWDKFVDYNRLGGDEGN